MICLLSLCDIFPSGKSTTYVNGASGYTVVLLIHDAQDMIYFEIMAPDTNFRSDHLPLVVVLRCGLVF